MKSVEPKLEAALITAEEFLNLLDDGRRVELINGVIVEMPPSSKKNTILAAWIAHLLLSFIMPRKLGFISTADGGYTVGPHDVLQPDVGFITKARAGGLAGVSFPSAPDLAVEVISPSERVGKVNEKLQAYFAAGTHQVWLVYPESRSVEVYAAADRYTLIDEKGMIDGGDLFSGFTLSAQELFSVLDMGEP